MKNAQKEALERDEEQNQQVGKLRPIFNIFGL